MFFKGKKDYKKKFARGNRVHVGLANFDFFLVHFIFTVKTEWSTRAFVMEKAFDPCNRISLSAYWKGENNYQGRDMSEIITIRNCFIDQHLSFNIPVIKLSFQLFPGIYF